VPGVEPVEVLQDTEPRLLVHLLGQLLVPDQPL
jgi:hypothetical protein